MNESGEEDVSKPGTWYIEPDIHLSDYNKDSKNDNQKTSLENGADEKDSKRRLDRRENSLMTGMLVRSSSYQALHSALARLYRLDDFTLEKIGQGFFSEVYKACHLVTGKIMVLKMNKLFSNRHNMLREVELMNRLNHPNILTYYGVCVHEGQVHALTQYINGGSLNSLLQNLRLELPWIIRTALSLDISRGMAYLHSKKVFHRDLTSKNILIKQYKDNGRIRLKSVIADFGLAAPIPQNRSVRLKQVGSPYWMAPEVIRGDWYDHRIDVFSFGIVLCEIIARCDADPDILPRTHNFGIHYLAFSKMCQSDCPPRLLEMAFQCCQILPSSRPSFKELETMLICFLTDNRPMQNARIQKVPTRKRPLSDESLIVSRTNVSEKSSKLSCQSGAVSSQEVIERITRADPYFQASSDQVNPFSSVKLPAKSRLVLQDGSRYCHSMPADNRNNSFAHQLDFTISSFAHLTTSDTSLSQAASPTHVYKSRTCSDGCETVSNIDSHPYSLSPHGNNRVTKFKSITCKCPSTPEVETVRRSLLTMSCKSYEGCSFGQEPVSRNSGNIPRYDGSASLSSNQHAVGLHVKRRGSEESGFFSVDDELCHSYSELSSASFISVEDEDTFGGFQGSLLCRSPSVITNSSEDLSALGCGHDLKCDFASPAECDRFSKSRYFGNTEGTATDIKSIVEFFERGYGSLRSMSEADRTRQLAANTRRRECMVPLLRNRFNNGSTPYQALTYDGVFRKHGPEGAALCHEGTSKGSKDRYHVGCISGRKPSKERPKIYITEGTVRAKRDIFESK